MKNYIEKVNVAYEDSKSINNKDKYELIDIMKFICAIFVVGIHAGIMSDKDSVFEWQFLNVVFRLAVPFFFIASGFLFGKKYLKNKNKLKENSINQIKRLIIPFIFWSLVLLPWVITQEIRFTGNILLFIYRILRLNLFNGYHIWFVLALAVAICMEYIFLKKNKVKYAIILSIILYMIALCGNSYYFLIKGTPIQPIIDFIIRIFTMVRNGIFVGFPLFTVGIVVSFYENKIYKISNKKLFIALIFFTITQILESAFIMGKQYIDDHSTFVSIIFVATIILMLCIKNKNFKLKKINSVTLRNLSTGIYFMHIPIIRYLCLVMPNLGNWNKFFIMIFASIIIELLLLKINNKYINMLIK